MKKERIKQFVSERLNRCEKRIIVLHYYEGMTMKEIGATLDLPESRISLIHSSLISWLEAEFNSP